MGYDSVYLVLFCVNLVVLRLGGVKGSALSVAACVAGHSSALVCAGVCVFVCIPGIHTKDAAS